MARQGLEPIILCNDRTLCTDDQQPCPTMVSKVYDFISLENTPVFTGPLLDARRDNPSWTAVYVHLLNSLTPSHHLPDALPKRPVTALFHRVVQVQSNI
jgi:hypothetical protein